MSKSYTLIQPTQFFHIEQRQKFFLPFTQWYNIQDPNSIIYGPFDFATIFLRKTRDLIKKEDWIWLISGSTQYDNDPPNISTKKEVFITFHKETQFLCKTNK